MIAFVLIFLILNGSAILMCSTEDIGFSFVNPKVIHEATLLNWFGVALLCVILHILFPVVAALYWFYKLCTVGRK